MKPGRRKLVGLASAVLLAPRVVAAQSAAKVYRVGYLSVGSLSLWTEVYYENFKKRMLELGYVEGRNIVFYPRWSETNAARLPGLAAELVALKPDVIVAAINPAVASVKQATATIPIVMVAVADPVGAGFVVNLARPGTNITGVANLIEETVAKTLELIYATIPKTDRIGVLMSDNPTHLSRLSQIQGLATRLGLKVVSARAVSPQEIDTAFVSLVKEKPKSLIVLGDAVFFFQRNKIVELAAQAGLPAIYPAREFPDIGGLMSYGANVADYFRLAADYVDKILKGAKPGDLPVQQPTKFELVINRKTAKALGIDIPQSVLLRADEVIE